MLFAQQSLQPFRMQGKNSGPPFCLTQVDEVSLHRSLRSAEKETMASGGELDATESDVYGKITQSMRRGGTDESQGSRASQIVGHAARVSWASDERLTVATSWPAMKFCWDGNHLWSSPFNFHYSMSREVTIYFPL